MSAPAHPQPQAEHDGRVAVACGVRARSVASTQDSSAPCCNSADQPNIAVGGSDQQRAATVAVLEGRVDPPWNHAMAAVRCAALAAGRSGGIAPTSAAPSSIEAPPAPAPSSSLAPLASKERTLGVTLRLGDLQRGVATLNHTAAQDRFGARSQRAQRDGGMVYDRVAAFIKALDPHDSAARNFR